MAVLDSVKAKKSLLKKGFKLHDNDHHNYLYYYNGKIVARTKISHNDQELNNFLIGKMYKQCQLNSRNEFIDLVNCPLDENGYIKILRERGIIS